MSSRFAAICNRTWQGSEAAMNGHVDKCLAESEKPKKSKKTKKQLKAPFPQKAAAPGKSQSFFGTTSKSKASAARR